jgi:hypothetical protein
LPRGCQNKRLRGRREGVVPRRAGKYPSTTAFMRRCAKTAFAFVPKRFLVMSEDFKRGVENLRVCKKKRCDRIDA